MLTKANLTRKVRAIRRKYNDTTSDFNPLADSSPEFILYGKLSVEGKHEHRFSLENTTEDDIDVWFLRRAQYEANKEKLLAEYKAQQQAEAENEHARKQAELKAAYKRGEGFVQINPIVGGVWTYEGKEYSYDWIRSL